MRKLLNTFATLMLATSALLPMKAFAFQDTGTEIVSDISAEELVSILAPLNWEAEIFYDDGQKTDYILLQVGNVSSFARLMDCTGEAFRRCRTILFFANFDLGARINPNYTGLLNTYNDNNVVGRAYYLSHPDETGDQVGLDLRISLHNGVTVAHLNHEAQQWEIALDIFLAAFNGE